MYQPFSQSAPPAGRMEMGPDGTLYFCDTRQPPRARADEDGMVRTVAGSGPADVRPHLRGRLRGRRRTGDRGASCKQPSDVAVAPSGNLYIADTHNSCVRKVDGDGEISTPSRAAAASAASRATATPADEALLEPPLRRGARRGRQPLHRRHAQPPHPRRVRRREVAMAAKPPAERTPGQKAGRANRIFGVPVLRPPRRLWRCSALPAPPMCPISR